MAEVRVRRAPESTVGRVISIGAILVGLAGVILGFMAVDGAAGYVLSIVGAVLAVGGLVHLGWRHVMNGDHGKSAPWFTRAAALLAVGGARYCDYLIGDGANLEVLRNGFLAVAGLLMVGEGIMRVVLRSTSVYGWFTSWRDRRSSAPST